MTCTVKVGLSHKLDKKSKLKVIWDTESHWLCKGKNEQRFIDLSKI